LSDDHVLINDTYPVWEVVDGKIRAKAVAALTALNERLRDDYIREIESGLSRWNRVIERSGLPFRLTLPHKGFHRAIGNFTGHHITPLGEVVSKEAWEQNRNHWLPSDSDYKFVQSLMAGRVVEPAKFANWIAPPIRGINHQPLNFEYVRFN
jgi:benzoyl-CoA 2,3-dioxygenase component B